MKKRLYKIEQAKKLDGVCGGIAEYLDVDPTIVRILWILLTCCSAGAGLVAYIACALVMPKKSDTVS